MSTTEGTVVPSNLTAPRGEGLTTRRLAWARREWRRSERGSWFTNHLGFNVTVFPTRHGWGIRVVQRYGDCQQFGRLRFESAAEAKARAFDALRWCEHHWGGNGRYPVATPPGGARDCA